MKPFIEYKEDIYKCSKCGICQSVCPVYKTTKNECAVSRGKFAILNGVIKNELNLNRNLVKNLDICLNCNICKEYCPSDIDAKKIFATVKNEFNSKNKNISNFLYSTSFFEFKMNLIKILATSYKLFKLDKIINWATPLLCKMGRLGRKIILVNSILKTNTKRKKHQKTSLNKGKIVFFEGCFNRYINPSSKNGSLNLIEELGYEILKLDLKCCGVSSYYSGHFNEFEKQAKAIIASIPKDTNAIICDCATCISVLKSYKDFFVDADFINQKTVNMSEFLQKNNYKKEFKKEYKITYHKPCHEEYGSENIFANLKNIKYAPLKDNNTCCGFAGEFAIKHQSISKKISKQKAETIIETDSDIAITTCPSCVMGLKQGLIELKQEKTVVNLSEFLNMD